MAGRNEKNIYIIMKKKCRTDLGYCPIVLWKKKIVLQPWVCIKARLEILYCNTPLYCDMSSLAAGETVLQYSLGFCDLRRGLASWGVMRHGQPVHDMAQEQHLRHGAGRPRYDRLRAAVGLRHCTARRAGAQDMAREAQHSGERVCELRYGRPRPRYDRAKLQHGAGGRHDTATCARPGRDCARRLGMLGGSARVCVHTVYLNSFWTQYCS